MEKWIIMIFLEVLSEGQGGRQKDLLSNMKVKVRELHLCWKYTALDEKEEGSRPGTSDLSLGGKPELQTAGRQWRGA